MPPKKPMKPGPKPKPESELRKERVEVVMTADERRRVESAAKAVDQPTAVFVRDAALRMADGLLATRGGRK